MRKLQGVAASPGVAVGPAAQFCRAEPPCERRTVEDREAEWARFEVALEAAREQLADICARAEEEVGAGQAAIFEAQSMMLEDPELLDAVRTAIEVEGVNAEAALLDAAEMYARTLEGLDNAYFRARAADVRDVAARVLRALLGVTEAPLADLMEPHIILARDLTPSDTMMLDKSMVLGFCTAEGGATSHTAILARGLGLPAVVGAGPGVLDIPSGARLLLNGSAGTVLVEPDEETVAPYRGRQAVGVAMLARACERCREPAVTRDGHRVEVVANIGSVEEARVALQAGAEGVGLLRTEFLYLERSELPDEEEQYRAYRAILDVFGDQPVVLRTLDIGGDKELPYFELPCETTPFLGLRAIRLSLERPELFKPQLRAALRAGVGRNLKLMFPMVTTVAEVRAARAVLEQCRAELQAEGRPVADGLEVGIMVEVPAAALMADHLAEEVDFFSIGTNDLSQYAMAADRRNSAVASLVSGLQPAILRLIRDVVVHGHARGRRVSLCGELASEPLAVPVLLGLGLDELSMSPSAIPLVKQIIRTLALEDARDLAQMALKEGDARAVEGLVRERVSTVSLG